MSAADIAAIGRWMRSDGRRHLRESKRIVPPKTEIPQPPMKVARENRNYTSALAGQF